MPTHSRRKKSIDLASWMTLAVTVVLFGISLFEKGFTQEILLEAGVFLISVKLVLASHSIQLETHAIDKKLSQLLAEQRPDSQASLKPLPVCRTSAPPYGFERETETPNPTCKPA
jgi:hypothetical protein